MSGRVLDEFAGPGGWDVAAAELGVRVIGIEHDAAACLTRAAAGHLTIRADVSTLDPARFRGLEGLIASPPCPTFSAAGGRAGIAELAHLIAHVHACAAGWHDYTPPESLGTDDDGNPIPPDPRSRLVLEPLRMILGAHPRWVALEQVPDVLPVWEAYRVTLETLSYSAWCGVLNAADYGVPQTRRRAILVAHRTKAVSPPEPSHCDGGASSLFGELAPWVTMADALGWSHVEVGYKRGAGLTDRHGKRPTRTCDEPAPTLTGSGLGAGGGAKFLLHTNRGQDARGNRQTRDSSAPAPALTAKAGGQWAFERPATTLCGDSRISPPGYRGAPDDYDADGNYTGARSMDDALRLSVDDALRLSVDDALRLQSFPADYPVQGTKSKQFEQIGNAVPPLLARRILEALL